MIALSYLMEIYYLKIDLQAPALSALRGTNDYTLCTSTGVKMMNVNVGWTDLEPNWKPPVRWHSVCQRRQPVIVPSRQRRSTEKSQVIGSSSVDCHGPKETAYVTQTHFYRVWCVLVFFCVPLTVLSFIPLLYLWAFLASSFPPIHFAPADEVHLCDNVFWDDWLCHECLWRPDMSKRFSPLVPGKVRRRAWLCWNLNPFSKLVDPCWQVVSYASTASFLTTNPRQLHSHAINTERTSVCQWDQETVTQVTKPKRSEIINYRWKYALMIRLCLVGSGLCWKK